MPSDPTPAIPLTYATGSDASLARAVAVCHWVAIGVLWLHAIDVWEPSIRAWFSPPASARATKVLAADAPWADALWLARRIWAVLDAIGALLALNCGRRTLYVWWALLLLGCLAAGASTAYFCFADPWGGRIYGVEEKQYWRVGLAIAWSLFITPQFAFLILFTRPAIVRARWTR